MHIFNHIVLFTVHGYEFFLISNCLQLLCSCLCQYSVSHKLREYIKHFKANFRLPFSLKEYSISKLLHNSFTTTHFTAVLTSDSECSDSC